MFKILLLLLLLIFLLVVSIFVDAFAAAADSTPRIMTGRRLSAASVDNIASLVQRKDEPRLWIPHAPSNAEQYWPFWLGSTPYDIGVLGVRAKSQRAPSLLLPLANLQIPVVVAALKSSGAIDSCDGEFELEMYPTEDPNTGRFTWAYTRFRRLSNSSSAWSIINVDIPSSAQNFNDPSVLTIVVPQIYRLWNAADANSTFNSFTEIDNPSQTHAGYSINDLYADPQYANCIFAQEPTVATSGSMRTDGWLWSEAWPLALQGPEERATVRAFFTSNSSRFVCYAINMPAQFNDDANFVAWKVRATIGRNSSRSSDDDNSLLSVIGELSFPSDVAIEWFDVDPTMPARPTREDIALSPHVANHFSFDAWKADVLQLDGEAPLNWPQPDEVPVAQRSNLSLTRKNSADPANQLSIQLAFLEQRYASLGINTWRQTFPYRNYTLANLIAEIPGRDPTLPPILFADHVDTAYDEDVFMKTGVRRSAPGADDNDSAAATLLQAAALLRRNNNNDKSTQLKRTVWLTHLTGEEYPADDLGVRHLLSELIANRTRILGVILMDMIAWQRHKNDTIFQISSGMCGTSRRLARFAVSTVEKLVASSSIPMALTPVHRPRLDPYSYLFNTDGDTIENMGFPVILLNEHINWYQNFDHPSHPWVGNASASYRSSYHTSLDVWGNIGVEYAHSTALSAIEILAQVAEHFDDDYDHGDKPSVVAIVLGTIGGVSLAASIAVFAVRLHRRRLESAEAGTYVAVLSDLGDSSLNEEKV